MKRAFVFALFLSCWIFIGCSSNNAAATKSTVQSSTPSEGARDEIVLSSTQQSEGMIQTQSVALSDAPEMLRAAGRIVLADDRTWHVGVRTVGLVSALYANLGDHVQKGQVLARYHADELREARAQYQTSITELNRLEGAATLAQRNYDRMQTLLELKAASAQQVDQARQDLVSAQAMAKNGEVEVGRNRVLLEDDLHVPADSPTGDDVDEVPIIAPASGYIIEKNVTPGMAVELSTQAFVIGDLSRLWMLASVRQADLGELRTGQEVMVTLPGRDSEHYWGKITNLGQQLDPATRVMDVRIVLDNPDNRLRPEMLATADIPVGSRKPALLIDSDAVQQVSGQDVVFVRIEADRFAVRPVRLGNIEAGKTAVLEGLQAGDEIVVHGSFILKSQLMRASLENE
jgi:cobalt-zinc-cadmium efflux system membrane fusion protein